MPQENSFFSKCKNQITKCVCPLENLQGMNYIALTINVGSSSENAKNAGIAHFLEHMQMNFLIKMRRDIFVQLIQIFIQQPIILM